MVVVSVGYGQQTIPRAELPAWLERQGLDPALRPAVEWIIDEAAIRGRPIGVGSIGRSEQGADDLFRSRYQVVATRRPGAVSFEGKWWVLRPGNAPAMPSDRTYHVRFTPTVPRWALAIDFTGDMAMLALLCPLVGLVQFGPINREPWHAQSTSHPHPRSRFVVAQHYPIPPRPIPPHSGHMVPVRVAAPVPTLRVRRTRFDGANNEAQVRHLQHLCNFWGWDDALGRDLIVDGGFGSKTDQAVRSMQRALRVTVDGTYGPVTARALQVFLDAMVGVAA